VNQNEQPTTTSHSQTIVFFHAHPDDEAIFSGGTIARLARAGHRVVIVMATSGGMGRTDGALGPTVDIAAVRERELTDACNMLGVARVVLLRYEDSGLTPEVGPHNRAFSTIDMDEAAQRVADVILEERASALAVYDEGGIYGHPDHLHVHQVGIAAARIANVVTLYEMTVDREYLHFVDTHLIDHARESLPHLEHVGLPTVFVSTTVDVRTVLSQKKAAIAAHASQVDSTSSVMMLSDDSFCNVYGYEWFVRTGPPGVIEELG
jgi:LmbE family N-acetylglucosaminyl deacetylase